MGPRLKPTSEPQILQLSDDTKFWTQYNDEKKTHEVSCDLCEEIINVGPAGTTFYQLDSHRTACRDKIAKRHETELRKQAGQQSRNPPIQPGSSEIPGGSTPRARPSTPINNPNSDQVPPEPTSGASIQELFSEIPRGCPGVGVPWSAGSIWGDYPYILHEDPDVGWEPIRFDKQTNTIFFRSENCSNPDSGSSQIICRPCQTLPHSVAFTNVQARAKEVKSHTNMRYLTSRQKDSLLSRMTAELRVLRNKVENLQRRNKHHAGQVTDFKRIVALIASEEFAGLRRILEQALARGATPKMILAILERALHKVYRARGGFNKWDLDLSFLVKAIGGPKLLYALQKSLGLASISTIRRSQQVPKLIASIGTPTAEEIHSNISAFFNPDIKPAPIFPGCSELPGNVLMFDGVALETRLRYCPERDAILGLCREHSNRVNTKVESLESLEEVRKALAETDKKSTTRVCYGSDATVVAIAPYANENNYTAVPIVVSPTDKTETGADFAKWLQTVLDAWRLDPNGEKMHGPIWAIESDGDSAFRLAKFILCMVKRIDPNSELGKILDKCLGINKYTSEHGAIAGSDLKHVAKRTHSNLLLFHKTKRELYIGFGTLTRNFIGISIGDTILKPTDIIKHLAMLPHITVEKAKGLLDPLDRQNVPKAILLIQEMNSLRDLFMPQHPSEAKNRHAINFYAEFMGYFVFPFIDVNQSLLQQIRSLSTYAHLCTAMYLKHKTNFLTNPLFADSQLIVRCIIITTARLQGINPQLKFYIIMDGTDRLEGVFCDTRTIDHAPNFDIEQLVQKLATGALINAIFQRNPDLDRGHRKMKLSGALGIDHINPASWKGNVVVGNADIPDEYGLGQNDANDVLEKYFGPEARIDWNEQFKDENWEYVGTSFSPEDNDFRSEMENQLFRSATPTNPEAPSISSGDVVSDEGPAQNADTYGLDLDNYFPDNMDHLDKEDPPSSFLKFLTDKNGKQYFKSSLVAGLSSNRSKKSTLRTQRVQGISVADFHQKKVDVDFDPLEEEDTVKIDDLVGILVRTEEDICLCTLIIKEFRKENQSIPLSAIHLNDQENPDSGITVVGQLMEMTQSADKTQWEWNKKFLKIDTSELAAHTKNKQLLLQLPSSQIFPLAPNVTEFNDIERATWTVESSQLEETKEFAWTMLDPDSDDIGNRVSNLPEVKNVCVPYRDLAGQKVFCINVPSHIQPKPKLDGKEQVHCKLCGTLLKLSVMRNHVGQHILFSLREKPDHKLLPVAVIGAGPCGWCGLEGQCHTQLTHPPKGAVQITSNCPYHYAKMIYKSAATSTPTAPCTNVPLQCPLCPVSKSGNRKTIWKYNAFFHLLAEHSTSGQRPPEVPPQFWIDTLIRHAEEQALGITADETDRFWAENTIPGSDDINRWVQESDNNKTPHGSPEKRQRERSGTQSTTGSDSHVGNFETV
ncbi:hypothetical protein DFH07DRAFT_993164 [Mycena maculata]|uniref:Uncharacterized protein n=1 Tax=Mycena maculata TaxID=230809 RepID=A0AAD7JVC5_9AGAR|nr:hypothetical protein DFH07DRAFT_993164 [Mycena maculata]